MNQGSDAPFEYVVVGSGAGGGTVAARLAEAGRRVLLLEAGGDAVASPPEAGTGDAGLPEHYEVPAFNAFATENPAMRWDFFVRHYAAADRQRRDPNYTAIVDGKPVDGVLYPRAGTLGGCTAHNAMITVYPHNADWDHIASLTGDASWRADHMRTYFERMEECRYRPAFYRWLSKIGLNLTRHGWTGWLGTETGFQRKVMHDRDLVKTIVVSALAALRDCGEDVPSEKWLVQAQLDPNDWRMVSGNSVGVSAVPLATRNHARNGSRERLLEVARAHPDCLTIELDALATRVLFDVGNRAIGVEYLKGARLYRAHAAPTDRAGELRQVFVSREVILAGGAFNTPQLLMLSGIGPAADLCAHGVPVRVDLAGVGTNLQDRYEVGVVNRMTFPCWDVLKGATFNRKDTQFDEWTRAREGVYASNGVVMAVTKRSDQQQPLPDLFCLALVGNFRGYFPGYSKLLPEGLNYLTWCILKAHTNNTAGTVTLRSADPRDTPLINFHYFEEGNDASGADLDAVVDGIKFARKLVSPIRDLVEEEELPGDAVQSEAELRDFVRSHAWGHHASCTCPIGPRERGGVVDGDFQVHGTKNLRIVDASVFPRIPGFFIASSVYMIGEKAADVILAAVARTPASGRGAVVVIAS